MLITRRVFASALASATLPVWAQLPSRQSTSKTTETPWPTQPLRIIVGFPAGSSPDMLARVIAEPLAAKLGQPVIVENKSGAAGNIGVDQVVKATDGHTIGLSPNGPLTTSKFLYSKLPYDPIRDIAPISLVATSPLVLAAGNHCPANTLTEAMLYFRNKGDKLSYGSVGNGSTSHLAMELLKLQSSIRPIHVPFQGFPAVITAMLSEQIDLSFIIPSLAMPHAKAGRIKILGVSSTGPSILVPDVVAIGQAINLPKFEAEVWNGIFAPRSMPQSHVINLAGIISEILRMPIIRTALFAQSWQVAAGSPEGLTRRIVSDAALWSKIIQMIRINLD